MRSMMMMILKRRKMRRRRRRRRGRLPMHARWVVLMVSSIS
jgi:hypothetical protein